MLQHVLDGSMGKYLMEIGLPKNETLWSALALIEPQYHELVIQAHKSYLDCGCNVITTNNYAVIPGYLSREGLEDELKALTKLSVKLAQIARNQYMNKQSSNKHDVKIAGCIPPLMESYRPDLKLSEEESVTYYIDIIESLKGVDIYLAETMGCIDEAIYVLKAMSFLNKNDDNNYFDKEIWISFSLNNEGNLRSNETVNDAILSLEDWMKRSNIRLIAFNCCLPEAVNVFFENKGFNDRSMKIMENNDIFLGIYPNALVMADNMNEWNLKEGGLMKIRDISPKQFYEMYVIKWLNKYGQKNRIAMIGGCCGFDPGHMKYTIESLNNQYPGCISYMTPKSKL